MLRCSENGKEHLGTSGAVQSAQALADHEEHSGILRNYTQCSGVRAKCAWCSGTYGTVHTSWIFGELFRVLRNLGKLCKAFGYFENYKECSSIWENCVGQSGI